MLLLARMASAVLIETPPAKAAFDGNTIITIIIGKGFSQAAVMNRFNRSAIVKSATFQASDEEIRLAVSKIGDDEYLEANGVVLGGVRYELNPPSGRMLHAVNGAAGVMIRGVRSKWIIAVYDGKKLTGDDISNKMMSTISQFYRPT